MIITAYIKHYDSIEMREIKESFAFLADYDTKKKYFVKIKRTVIESVNVIQVLTNLQMVLPTRVTSCVTLLLRLYI